MALSFDATYYMTARADVLNAFVNAGAEAGTGQNWAQFAEQHYNDFGWKEGYNPNSIFDTTDYLAANRDVLDAGVNPFTHYLTFGANEGRAPSATFIKLADFGWEAYLAANTDLGDAGITTAAEAYGHFVIFGQFESRPGTPDSVTPPVPGETFTLTTGTDFADVEGSVRNAGTGDGIPSTFKFTNANETVNATHLTLTAVDSLSDGSSSDHDVLNIAVKGFLGGTAAVAGIENINVALSAAGWGELDMTNYSGVQNVVISGPINPGDYVGAYNFADSGVTHFDTSGVTADLGDWTEIIDTNADQNITVVGGDSQTDVELGDGNNTITTGAAADYVWVGDGNNVIHTGGGADEVEVGIGNNTIDVGDGINEVYVYGDGDTNTVDGNNTITSGSGVDFVEINGDGNNSISTGGGSDTVEIYGAGNNTINTGTGNDVVLIDGAGNNIVNTGDGADSITVDAGAGSGANVITAGAGADAIDVSLGGANELVFHAGDTGITHTTIDVVTGFDTAVDTLNFGVAGTNDNYFESAQVVVDYAAALAYADGVFTGASGDLSYVFVDGGATGSWLFHDADFSGEADASISLVGVSLAGIEYQDLVA